MQKTKVVCLILAVVLASAGTAGIVMGFNGGNTVAPTLPNNAVNTVMDKPSDGTPVDRTAIENLYIAQGELQRKGGFVGTTRGTSTSAGIKQEVYNNRVVVEGNVFKEMITVGIVKNAYQLFMYGDNYLYRKFDNIKSASNVKWADTASKYSKEDFLKKFGHRSDSLTGYILNDETIVSGTLESEENGLFRYRYVLDINTAPARMLYEMKTNSNMSDYSTFVKAEIIVVMDADWQVKTVTTDCQYKVPMFGGVDCVEDITETFSDLTSQDLPEKDFFEQFFNAQVEEPVVAEPDALSILMKMFEPYIGNGNSLNAEVTATMDGQTVLNGMLSASVDIENLDNIAVAAKLGDDLFVEYEQGKIYVTYQDFKASTTVDGIMGVVNAFMPSASANLDVDADDILSKFTYSVVGDLCTVSLPLELGKETIEINIYAKVVENGYEFINAEVLFGSLELNIELNDGFQAPAREGNYPEILGLLDLVKNGVIYGNVNALGMDLDVIFDLATTSLYASNDDLSVLYSDNTIYAEYGAIKAKLSMDDIDRIMTLLRLAGIMDGSASIELPQVSIEQVVALLSQITATSTENGVAFSLSQDGLSASVYLVATANGWNVDQLTVVFDGNVVTLAVTAPSDKEIPNVDDSNYADIMEVISEFINPIASLASASSYGAEFNFGITLDNKTYNVNGSFDYDAKGNIRVNATVTCGVVTLIKANVIVSDGIVYLDVNGIKTAFAVGEMPTDFDLKQIVSQIYGANEFVDSIIEGVYGIIDAAKNIDIQSVDFVNVIKQFSFVDGTLSVTVDASFLGLSEISVKLSADDFNDLVVEIDGLEMSNIALDVKATLIANVGKIKLPNADDYILNLKGNIEQIEFALSADLLNMDISASVNVLDNTVLLRYVGGKVYAQIGEVAIVGTIDKLAELIGEITAAIGMDGSSIDMSGLSNIDLSLQTVLNSITIDTENGLIVGIELGDCAKAAIEFDSEANLAGITANVMGYSAEVSKSTVRVPQLDVNDTYISAELLAKQIVAIYNNFKNFAASGIAVNLATSVSVNGASYELAATLNYNNGLYLNANIADNNGKLVALDMYLVDNVLYAEVNGVRIATELPEQQASSNSNVELATIMGALAQAKGYNDVLDSVITAIEQLPDKLNGVNYLDLLTSLTYDNDVLSASVNGEALGLSAFEVTLQGTNNVALTVSKLAIGNVSIESLTVNAIPVCEQVTAPTSEYVTEIQIEAMGFDITAKLDLLNKTVVAKTTLLDHELGVYYANNVAYVSYGAVKAKLAVADVDKLIAVISTFVKGGMPSVDMPELDVKQILGSLSKVATVNGYDFNAVVAGVSVTLSFDANAKLTKADIKVNDIDVKATLIEGATYPSFDLNADYVDLAALVEAYASDVRSLIDSDGYDVALDGSFAFDNNVYDVQGNVVYNGGLYVNANVSYNSANMLNVELWYVDNTLYVSTGDLKLAIAMSQQSATQGNGSGKLDLTAYKGYNPYVDGVLDVVQGVIDKLTSGDVDYIALIAGMNYANGELNVDLNGELLGLSQINVILGSGNGLTAKISNLTVDKMNASLTASVKASNTAVVAPQGDFTTNLSIRIDDKNTIYANLDFINGVYNFRLDDMYVMCADNVVSINKGDMYVSGNINQIIDYVKRIDELVNEFSGATESTMSGINLDTFKNIDVKAIVNSLIIGVADGKVTVGVKAFGFDISAVLANGKLRQVNVPVSLIDKTLEIEPCKAQTFDKFDGEQEYIQIEQVFNDYFPAFERLVHTNSWKFSFDGDTLLTLNNANYMVATGSYFEFYYKNTEGMDTFKLRARLDVRKQKADYSWQPYMDIDIVYKNGNIYLTDRGRLVDGKDESDRNTIRLTVSVNTLIKCYDLYDEIVAVVPQIGELVEKMMSAKSEAENNAENISYSTILNDVSYVDGLFGLDLNGAALLSKLGNIALLAQTYGEGLSLNALDLAFDNISLQVRNLRVYASEVVEVDGVDEYATVQDINAYDFDAYHMDFNSLYELLSSFVITATPAEENDGARSFYIDGTAFVKFTSIAQLKIGLSVKVDITKDNDVFISAKVHRSQPTGLSALAYSDKGGDSYLNYSSVGNDGLGSFTVIRDSMKNVSGTHKEDVEEMYYYCDACNLEAEKKLIGNEYQCPTKTNWLGTKRLHDESHIQIGWRVVYDMEVSNTAIDEKNCFAEYDISTEKFTANIMDYIMELFNFSSMIKDPITDAMQKPNDNDFGIEDIFKDYYYSDQEFKYSLNLDLSAIDSNLGAIQLNILHTAADDFTLTNLNGTVKLLGTMCDANLNMTLKPSTCGETTEIVANNTRW